MKRITYIFFTYLLVYSQLFAQVPQSFSYQAVAYDSDGGLLASQAIGVKIAILDGSVTGTVLYEETHSTTTSDIGIFSLKVGDGTVTSGDFSSIDWGASLKFLDVFLDPDGGSSYTHVGTIQLLSVPYALHAATADELSAGIIESDPVYASSLAAGITASDTASWNNKPDSFTETDPAYATSLAAGITQSDTAAWNSAAGSITENDPVFASSLAAAITATHTTNWDSKLGSFTETDPIYDSSIASGITGTDTTGWNNKLDSFTETDPIYGSSLAAGITGTDTTYWNSKLGSFTETDPIYGVSMAAGITGTDTTYWNDKLDSYTETDPIYGASIATGITSTDTTYWNDKLDSYTETDPVFGASIATGITGTDTTYWNDKLDEEIDGSVTNEIQTISRTGLTVTLTDGGTFQDSVNVYTAGTGIDITGTEVSNTAPANTYSIGDFAQGGIVFWVDESGEHGLVCAKSGISSKLAWYAGTLGDTRAYGDGPFSGWMNTAIILSAHITVGDDGSNYAARYCANLSITEGGIKYSDWYLPSKAELALMYDNKTTIDATATANGGDAFYISIYWSSTESNSNGAWNQSFNDGTQNNSIKSMVNYVRAVRAF
jgi:hypothetical protein